MKINTPEGLKEARPLEFSIEEPERTIKITLEDGTVLLCRATIASVALWQSDKGDTQYFVNTNLSVVKIS